KPKPKAVNTPSLHSIRHGLDKPGVFTTVSLSAGDRQSPQDRRDHWTELRRRLQNGGDGDASRDRRARGFLLVSALGQTDTGGGTRPGAGAGLYRPATAR